MAAVELTSLGDVIVPVTICCIPDSIDSESTVCASPDAFVIASSGETEPLFVVKATVTPGILTFAPVWSIICAVTATCEPAGAEAGALGSIFRK